ncbi:MAG: glycosyltransferase family 2 protein, partial [Candidatus Aminicenantales bacterium]
LDSDDLWRKDKIGVQMGFMKAFPDAKVCYTDEIWIRQGVFVNPRKKHRKYSGWIFDKVLPLCLISLSSALFRRDVFEEIGGFDEGLPACEDYDFGIRLARKYPVHFIPKPLIIKRGGHPDQLSRKYWGMDRFRIHALEKALQMDLTSEQERLVRQEIVRKSEIVAKGFMKRNRNAEARKYLTLIEKYKESEEKEHQVK